MYIYIYSLFSADNDIWLKPHYAAFPTKKVLAAAKRDAATLELERLQQSGQRFLSNPAGIKAPGGWPKKLRYVGGKNGLGKMGGEMRSHIWHPRGVGIFLVSKCPDGSLDSLIVDSWLWPVMGQDVFFFPACVNGWESYIQVVNLRWSVFEISNSYHLFSRGNTSHYV